MAQQITYDKAYDTVGPGDFPAMLDVPRYGRRTDAFDGIISATHDHFWDPLDQNYIDFDQPFDMVPDADRAAGRRWSSCKAPSPTGWTSGQKIGLANDVMHWSISNLLHGEQGALSLSASLCHILLDPGAQEYAANQAREEARHVAGLHALYRQALGRAAAGRQDDLQRAHRSGDDPRRSTRRSSACRC